MNERPILFSTEMVQAILAGNKTQTRRVTKPQPVDCDDRVYVHCPFGNVGDRVWVRETWRIIGCNWEMGDYVIEYKDGTTKRFESVQDIDEDVTERYALQCDEDMKKGGWIIDEDEDGEYWRNGRENVMPTRWRPSIFMPRAFSRITLEITDIRVERVQDVSEKDACAEGWSLNYSDPTAFNYWNPNKTFDPLYETDIARRWFQHVWDSINKKRDYGWENNPWVWVLSFRKVEVNNE